MGLSPHLAPYSGKFMTARPQAGGGAWIGSGGRLLQLDVLGLGFLEDGDVRVGLYPQ